MYTKFRFFRFSEVATNNDNTDGARGEYTSAPFFEDYEQFTIQAYFDNTLPIYLECGFDYDKFDNYTMAEVELMVESYNNKIKRELLFRADMDNRNVINLANKISLMMSKDAKDVKFEDLYGHLMEEEVKEKPKKINKNGLTEEEEAMMLQQQMMLMQYASINNKKYK